jgi:hypothetical protein
MINYVKGNAHRHPYYCSLWKFAVFVFSLAAVFCFLNSISLAQGRDYLTDEEVELIRDTQQIDQRIEVLTRCIDRRFTVLRIDVGPEPARQGKEWGALPSGTRVELLSDIRNILQKAVDDIDNLSARPNSMVIDPEASKDKKKPKGFSDLFPKAVRNLAAAAHRYQPALRQALDMTKDQHERGLIADSIDLCDEIIASVQKL